MDVKVLSTKARSFTPNVTVNVSKLHLTQMEAYYSKVMIYGFFGASCRFDSNFLGAIFFVRKIHILLESILRIYDSLSACSAKLLFSIFLGVFLFLVRIQRIWSDVVIWNLYSHCKPANTGAKKLKIHLQLCMFLSDVLSQIFQSGVYFLISIRRRRWRRSDVTLMCTSPSVIRCSRTPFEVAFCVLNVTKQLGCWFCFSEQTVMQQLARPD